VHHLIVFITTTKMGQDIVYQWIEDGVNEVVSTTPTPDINIETSGFADLTLGRATISSYHAGKAVILTRNQDNTTAIGNVYIYAPNTINQVSFEIRSTNNSDNGTVYWQIVE
jgi:hypothetical protein